MEFTCERCYNTCTLIQTNGEDRYPKRCPWNYGRTALWRLKKETTGIDFVKALSKGREGPNAAPKNIQIIKNKQNGGVK